MVEWVVAAACLVAIIARWVVTTRRHRVRLDGIELRIHVNGIRGKSSVSRLIGGVLREAGYTVIGKTTGSAAVVIDRHGVDHPIVRSGPATILEQLEIVERWVDDGVDALVIECMAINPDYQRVCERQIVRSQIGCLTNVREDHQDVMGETLEEIARSLLNTCPADGVLITSEQDPALIEVMREEVDRRGTTLVLTDPEKVTIDEMRGFSYIEFEDNVAIGLEVARRIGIPRDVALRGMWSAPPDPGVLRIKEAMVGTTRVTWANMFAVNDRESAIFVLYRIQRLVGDGAVTVGILNNRLDRQQRAIQFADIAANDLATDYLATFGSYERVVTDRLLANDYPAGRILNLGDERNPTWDEMVEEMITGLGADHVLLVGLVNIHTHQAEMLVDFFDEIETTELSLSSKST